MFHGKYELKEFLKKGIKKGEFTLSSGKKSNYYINVKEIYTNPKILKKISENMKNLVKEEVDAIAGVAVGGIPLAVALSLETGKPFIIVRKKEKRHGISSRIEGKIQEGAKVIVVEDVTTTGQSVLRAVEILRKLKYKCEQVICVVDREEGAEENLKKAGVKLISLFKAKELI